MSFALVSIPSSYIVTVDVCGRDVRSKLHVHVHVWTLGKAAP